MIVDRNIKETRNESAQSTEAAEQEQIDGNNEIKMTYEEQRKLRIQRNAERLAFLGFKHKTIIQKSTTKDDEIGGTNKHINTSNRSVMLRKRRRYFSINDLMQKWPHRSDEIHALDNILSPKPHTTSLFITGNQSTGKTGILRDYLNYIKASNPICNYYTAFVDCVERKNIEDCLECCYFDITSSSLGLGCDDSVGGEDEYVSTTTSTSANAYVSNNGTTPISKFHHALCSFFQKEQEQNEKPVVLLVFDDVDRMQPKYALGQLLLHARDVNEYQLCIVVCTKKRLLIDSCKCVFFLISHMLF